MGFLGSVGGGLAGGVGFVAIELFASQEFPAKLNNLYGRAGGVGGQPPDNQAGKKNTGWSEMGSRHA
jgi:hypothetical protein